jgi:hypothetical protein
MRHVPISVVAIVAGVTLAAASSHAGPTTVLTAAASRVEGGFVQKVQVFPRRYYRRYGYGPYAAPPPLAVPAVPAVPVAPPVVVEEPVVVLPPPRPVSCGEYRYWNGQYCVDARYNTPYLGPRY